MISLDEARRFVLQDLVPLPPRDLALAHALGCVAAQEVTAREPSPRFENSSMDGFALRAIDTRGGGRRLRVTNSIFAGDTPSITLDEGEAARIMTGFMGRKLTPKQGVMRTRGRKTGRRGSCG